MYRVLFPQKLVIRPLLVASILFLAANSAVSAADNFDAVFKNAGAQFSQGSYEEALKLYRKANGMKKTILSVSGKSPGHKTSSGNIAMP